MVRTVYKKNGIEVSEEMFFLLMDKEDEFMYLESYCECLECGRKLPVNEICECDLEW